jgi:hypothetical protein
VIEGYQRKFCIGIEQHTVSLAPARGIAVRDINSLFTERIGIPKKELACRAEDCNAISFNAGLVNALSSKYVTTINSLDTSTSVTASPA